MEENAGHETVGRTRAQDWRLTLALLGFGFALSVMVIVTFAVQNHAQMSARSAILSELSRMRGAYRVRLNDRDVDEGALLVASIRRMRSVRPSALVACGMAVAWGIQGCLTLILQNRAAAAASAPNAPLRPPSGGDVVR